MNQVRIVPRGNLWLVQILTVWGWIDITDKPVCLNDARDIRKSALTWKKS
tara:strand:+ start:308 stop:457 length:150 start_codon:yes stop_codon:yes gene_type:complete